MLQKLPVVLATIAPDIPTNPEPVSAGEFAQKVSQAVIMLINSIAGVIVPVAVLSLLVSVILVIAGGITHSSNIKKAGAGGIGAAVGGLLIYYGLPLIMSLLAGIQQIFN
jgi:hypothetical protein